MKTIIQDCPFDSALFGYAVGSVFVETLQKKELYKIIEKAKEDKYHLLYLKSRELFDFEMEGETIIFVDEKTTFKKIIHRNSIINDTAITLVKKYSKDLYELTLESGHSSRFKIDPNFKNGEFEKLYQCWLENSLSGEIADKVFVVNNAIGKPCGLLTLAKKKEKAVIGLVAVNEKKKGIGRRLIQEAFIQTQRWDLTQLEVTTQGQNKGACRFYEACGFKKKEVVYVYHWWNKS